MTQREAVRGQPVCKHRLKFEGEEKDSRHRMSKNLHQPQLGGIFKVSDVSERQTDRGEVDGEREDDQRHYPEHGLHGSQVGVVDTRLCTQLSRKSNNVVIKEKFHTRL